MQTLPTKIYHSTLNCMLELMPRLPAESDAHAVAENLAAGRSSVYDQLLVPVTINHAQLLVHPEPFQYCPVFMFLMSSLFLSIAILSDDVPVIVTVPGAGVPTGLI